MNTYYYEIETPPAPLMSDRYNGFVEAGTPELALEVAAKECVAWKVDYCIIREPKKNGEILAKGYFTGKELIEISRIIKP